MKTLFLLLLLALAARAAEEQAIVNEQKINVRGQPSLIGEVITQLQKGEQVTVLDYVKNDRAKGGEPTNWAKIKLPSNTPVWVYAPMVKDSAVGASRLNLRAGPGDNYSVIGRLNKGDKVNTIRTMGDWIEIEAPASAYAFIDASLIKPRGAASAAPVVAAAPRPATQTPPTAAQTAQPQVVSTPPAEKPATVHDELAPPIQPQIKPEPTFITPAPNAPSTTVGASAPPQQPQFTPVPIANAEASTARTTPATPAKVESVPGRRIVRREGIIRATRSIQAPTWYELVHPQTKKTINYLHEEKLGVKLKQDKGQKVVVSGEEAIDARWPNTPILEIETLDIVP